MILVSQTAQSIVPFPCAVRISKHNGETWGIIANDHGQEYVIATYSSIVPAKMELGRLIAIAEIPADQWPTAFRFVKDVKE